MMNLLKNNAGDVRTQCQKESRNRKKKKRESFNLPSQERKVFFFSLTLCHVWKLRWIVKKYPKWTKIWWDHKINKK